MDYDALGRIERLGFIGSALDCDEGLLPENLVAEWDYDGVAGDNALGKLVLTSRKQNRESVLPGPDFVETEYHYQPVPAGGGRNAAMLAAIERRIPGLEESLVTSFEYDGPRLLTIEYPAPQSATPFSVRHEYDDFGNVIQVRDGTNGGDAFWTLVEADQGQRVRQELFGNNVETDYLYGDFGGSECAGSDACIPGMLTRQATRVAGGEELRDVRYRYDAMGSLKSRDREGGAFETFAYDGLSRLTAYAKNLANGDLETEEYSYSAGGDILGVMTQLPGQDAQVRIYGYENHRVMTVGSETYEYDGNGNQTERTLVRPALGAPPGVFEMITQSLDYNDFNMPWRVDVDSEDFDGEVLLDYDADQNRVAKRGPQETTLYGGEFYECIGQTPLEGNPVVCDEHRFKVYAGGALVAQLVQDADGTEVADQRRNVHRDHLGSATLLTDGVGTVREDRDFAPFGGTRTDFGATSVRAGFTGHEHDPELSGINMRGRFYDAGLRRFMQADPFVTQPGNSQGWNRYSYVGNSPLAAVDPSGFSTITITPPCQTFTIDVFQGPNMPRVQILNFMRPGHKGTRGLAEHSV